MVMIENGHRSIGLVAMSYRRVRRLIWICSAAVLCLLAIYCYANNSQSPDYKVYYSLLKSANRQEFHCNIPHPNPWDPTIQSYVHKPKPLKCKELQPDLTSLDGYGTLLINKSAASNSELDCHYSELMAGRIRNYMKGNIHCLRCFNRIEGNDVILKFGPWVGFKDEARPGCEFLEVSCSKITMLVNIPIYSKIHSQIVVNEKRVTKTANGFRKPSVLLFVIDSVSRSNLIRSLPKTLKVLQTRLNSVLLDGYTKVGDNSFPNAIALLTGKISSTAGQSSELPDDMSKSFFDDWPIIWKSYHNKEYVTYYAEDYPEYNLFQYLSNGFYHKPVDHYFRPFWVHLWGSLVHRRSTHLCYGSQSKLSLQIEYLKQFLVKYKDNPKWAFNWQTEIGHDWMNQVNLGDDELSELFSYLSPFLDNTFVFVLSDHGHRFDPIRETVVGRIEERMPFMTLAVPKSIRQRNPEVVNNLQANSQRLTSAFDVYITMQDILHMDAEWKGFEQLNWTHHSPRGLSLLRPIPDGRHCADAGIPEDYCVCQQETIVNTSHAKVKLAASHLVEYVNELISIFHKCSKLSLMKIHNAQCFLPNMRTIVSSEESILFGGVSPSGFYMNYRVAVEVGPSGALLEATLRHDVHRGTMKVIGDVNRIDKYGNQSKCIQSKLLRKYCFCKPK